MEIVLGIFLLFGAFTLGAVSSDGTDHETHTTQMESAVTAHQTQAAAASSLQNCQASESARYYRDLTISIAQPVIQQPTHTEDDEDAGWDE
jgi:hypothetical protein